MTLKLDKVNRGPHLSTLVASSITREIAQGRLKPGDQLPTEQALATTFGVSRNVVREAIARLRSEGRIWSQQGRGAFVTDASNATVLTIDHETLQRADSFRSLFELRGIDFQRRLLSKKRKLQDSLDAMDHSPDDDDPERTVKTIGALRQDATPEITVENRQRFEHVHGRLQALLTQNEYSTYTMLKVEGMAVKDIAKALDVTVRSVNNYKNAALAKIDKEFKQ